MNNQLTQTHAEPILNLDRNSLGGFREFPELDICMFIPDYIVCSLYENLALR